MEKENPAAPLITIIEYVLPNLEALNLSRELTYQLHVPADYLLQALAYSTTYAAIVMMLGVVVFARKDLS